LCALGLPVGCDDPASRPAQDRQEVLRQTVALVILPILAALETKTAALAGALSPLVTQADGAQFAAARAIFREARALWSQSEAFLIGPSDDLAITGGAIDSSPPNAAKIDALVSSDVPLDAARVASLGGDQRGFPGIEHLLFHPAGDPEADRSLVDDRSAARRRALLALQAGDLAGKCAAVATAWAGDGGFGRALAEAGVTSERYANQKDAVDVVVTALLALAERILVAKLAKPLGLDTGGPPRPELEEAPRSDGSLAAIADGVRGIRAIYLCEWNGRRGASLAAAVAEISANADRSFRAALEAALAAAAAVSQPMRVALAGDRAPLVALHGAMQSVKRGIATDVASALGASLGFGYSDTD
jgi:predicted lipoprotein